MAQKKLTSIQAKKYAREFVQYMERQHKLPVSAAYLFGSYAKGKTRAWSDVDVCIVSPKFKRVDPLTFLWLKRRDIDVERGIEPYGIAPQDFVNFNPIAWEIKKHGIKLA